ncbi:BON domain protein [Gimesia algae]|uniref:BON domain protein n=2 Tax=Gimesia algae TaxID=2527971 RepID=A0A517VF01_9PLAN|nr:BON domain protein [Gimesia algae]
MVCHRGSSDAHFFISVFAQKIKDEGENGGTAKRDENRLPPPHPENQLVVQITRVLRSTGYADLSQIRVSVEQGDVLLEGQIPTYFLKQVAQAQVLPLEEVKFVSNNLVVENSYNHH